MTQGTAWQLYSSTLLASTVLQRLWHHGYTQFQTSVICAQERPAFVVSGKDRVLSPVPRLLSSLYLKTCYLAHRLWRTLPLSQLSYGFTLDQLIY